MNAKTYRDIDSQADRYRDTIRAMEALQTEAQGHNQTITRAGEVYPTPVREGVFDRNKKYDGVKYADNKTRARRFELGKCDQAYNPSRMVAVTAADAIIDPHVTIRHEQALPAKDPGYYPLVQQSQWDHDAKRRVIQDYTGTPIIKVDQRGGIFDNQMPGTYKTLSALEPKYRSTRATSQKYTDLTQALQTVSGGVRARDAADINSNVSTRGLMQRKLYFMKMMLRNERQANNIIKKRIGELSNEMHQNNSALRNLDSHVPGQKPTFSM